MMPMRNVVVTMAPTDVNVIMDTMEMEPTALVITAFEMYL